MASLFRPWYTRGGLKKRCRTWYAQYKDHSGKTLRVSLGTTNRAAAQLKLAELVRGAASPAERRPIAEHVDAWAGVLESRGTPTGYRRLLLFHVRRLVSGCSWKTLADVCGADADRFLRELRTDRSRGHSGGPLAPKSRNDYRESLRTFCRWCVRDRRLAVFPLDGWPNESITTDRRHDRRPLTPDELGRLLAAARASERVYRGLTGEDRYFLYLVACATGFRVAELASLTSASFALDESPPVVRLAASSTKNRKPACQPLPGEIVPLLRDYLYCRKTDKNYPVWPGRWTIDAVEMMSADMATAGIPYVVQGPDGPLYADFHALRHTAIALLDVPGMTLKKAMQLARHSDPRLTMRVYGRAGIAELSTAVSGTLALPLALAADADQRSTGPPDANTGNPGCEGKQGSHAGCEDRRCGAGVPMGHGIAHRWTHGFFLVHAEVLAFLLARAA